MAAAALATEAGLDGVGVAAGHRQPDQVGEGALDVGHSAWGKVSMAACGVDNDQIGPADHDAQLHVMQVPGPERPVAHGRWSCRVPMTT